MSHTLKIAFSEIKYFFVSPVAWFLLAMFCVHMSIYFVNQLYYVIDLQFGGFGPAMTRSIFTMWPTITVFGQAQTGLLFYIPLLTMALISRERYNGSIKLLLSSPLPIRSLVLGKFLAVSLYLLLFAFFLLFLVILAGLWVKDLDYGLALSALLGFYLLAVTYAAIGLFMSTWTMHQIVAALSTIALLGLLSFVGAIGQRIPIIDEIAYWLSISGRADLMRAGLVTSKDTLYFILITVLFLAFTYLKLSAGRRAESKWLRRGRYGVVLALAVLAGYITSLPGLTYYADMSRPKSNTLSEGSLTALEGLKGPVTITILVNALDSNAYRFLPAERKALYRRLFEKHERAVGRFDVRYQYYYADTENLEIYEANPGKSNEALAREYADQNNLNFAAFLLQEEVDKAYNLSAENYRNVYLFEWNDRRVIVRNFNDPGYFPFEQTVSAALRRLYNGHQTIAYATGQEERRALQRGDSTSHHSVLKPISIRASLVNHGFDVTEITLDAPIPEEVDILVVAGPTQPYSEEALIHLKAYIHSGRDLLFMIEPDTNDIVGDLLPEVGIARLSPKIIEPKQDLPSDLILAQASEQAAELGFVSTQALTGGSLILSGVTAIYMDQKTPFKVTPILKADGISGIDTSANEVALAFALERALGTQNQRIIVVGDTDFMSPTTLTHVTDLRGYNYRFPSDLFHYLSHGEYPINISRPAFLDTQISIDKRDISRLRLVMLGGIPAGILLMGAIVLVRRRRR